jgi:phosphoribosylamine-glycine ligase
MDKVSNIECASEDDYVRLVNIAEELEINLVVPGLDVPLVGGIEGYFRAGKNFSNDPQN